MADFSMAQLNAVLQNDYLPGFRSQINEESSYFYKLMEKNTTPSMGANSTFLATFGRSGGIGNRDEDGTLPKAAPAGRKQVSIIPKNFFARFALSDRLIKASRGSASFMDEFDNQMQEILRDSKDSLNRQMFGDGTGKLTGIKTANATAAKTIACKDVKYLCENQIIDVVKADGSIRTGEIIIEAVDETTNTITVDTATITEVTDVITIAGSYKKEVTGLDLIMTPNTSIYGMDRTSNTWFNPSVIDLKPASSQLALSDEYMEKAIQYVDRKAGSKPDIIIAGYESYRALKNYLAAFQRYSEMETRYDAGHMTLSYDGIPVERDKYQGEQVMDFLTMDTFELLSIGELFDWMNMDGSILQRVPNKAAYEASLTSYAEIKCSKPSANCRLKNISTIVG